MKPDEKIVFCQIDAHLDTNPKIRRAGRDGRDIFEFLLRRVAIGRTEGTVPLKYIEPWYLADQLMMSEDEARHGTSRAVTARLIEFDESAGVVRIVGWSSEWGRRPKPGAERTKEWRDRSSKYQKAQDAVTERDDVSSRVTVGDESDAREEKRGDQKRGDQEKSSARPAGGGLHLESVADMRKRKARAKPSEPTPAEAAIARTVLDKLGEYNGVRYSGTAEHTRLIVNQLRAGLTEADLRKVIGYCAFEKGWKDDPEMLPYLRPETLFGPRTISKYLDPARAWFKTIDDTNTEEAA